MKEGFKSITVSKEAYENLHNVYLSLGKSNLSKEGITSFSGYITNRLHNYIKNNFSQHTPLISKLQIIDKTQIVLQDRRINKIILLEKKIDKSLFCLFCNSVSCSHVGFCYSLHEIYPIEPKILEKREERGERADG